MDIMSSPSCSITNYEWLSNSFFDDQTETQLVLRLLPQASVRNLHDSLVSDPNDGVIRDSRYEDENIIISHSTFFSLLPPKLKQMSAQ